MASNTGFLSTTELDFTAIKSNLITYLQAQPQFSDYNFEASNFNVLLDVLSYNTYLNSFYLNMVGSEMFLDTAQLKESGVSHSKELNYLPRSRTSAVAYVNITIDTGTATPAYITIPKYYPFTSQYNGATINFTTPTDLLVKPVNGVYSVSNTAIYEGTVVTEYFLATGNTNSFTMQSNNMDTSSISVYVYESDTSTTSYLYERAESLFGLTPTSNAYFIQGYGSNQYQLYFGNDVTGRKLTTGNLIKVQYRDTLGGEVNGSFIFRKTGSVYDDSNRPYTTISVETVIAAAEGSERESLDSIKFNAPRYFPTQERAVTTQDYVALVKAKFAQIQSVNAYGGEEMIPAQYGKVAISVKPYGTSGLISDSLKINIINYLKLKSLTTEPIIVDPEFFYIDVKSQVNYDSRLTSLSSNQIKALAQNAITNYGTVNLTDFDSDLRYSKLIKDIDAVDGSIISNDTELKIIKRWSPIVDVSSTLTFSFDNELYHEESLYKLPEGHELSVQSSNFTYTYNGSNVTAFIGDDGLGTLYVYTIQVVNSVVTRTPLATIGSVNYVTGEIIITTTVAAYPGNHISIYGKLLNKDVFSIKNKFLIIESQDILVTINNIAQ